MILKNKIFIAICLLGLLSMCACSTNDYESNDYENEDVSMNFNEMEDSSTTIDCSAIATNKRTVFTLDSFIEEYNEIANMNNELAGVDPYIYYENLEYNLEYDNESAVPMYTVYLSDGNIAIRFHMIDDMEGEYIQEIEVLTSILILTDNKRSFAQSQYFKTVAQVWAVLSGNWFMNIDEEAQTSRLTYNNMWQEQIVDKNPSGSALGDAKIFSDNIYGEYWAMDRKYQNGYIVTCMLDASNEQAGAVEFRYMASDEDSYNKIVAGELVSLFPQDN